MRYLLMSLNMSNILTTLSWLLLERKVLMISASHTLLTYVGEALLSLL